MKYFILIFLICFFSACSGTKGVINSSSKNTPVTKKANDSITKATNEAITEDPVEIVENKNINNNEQPEVEHETTLIYEEAFNHVLWNDLLKKHVSEHGNVNYKAFKTDINALKKYITSLGDNMPNDSWIVTDEIAYWINAYNAMTIDLILRHYPIKSIKDIKNPWEQRYWKLGDKWYNLDEIEHQILRKMNEPRIHFAIVCASYSCPKLSNEAYTSENLEEQLTEATRDFLHDSQRNTISENHIEISKIFQWFAKDFKQNGSLIDFLNQYSDTQISEQAKIRYKDYNWALNE
ncbi:DUF547 domain-containing protein [Sabulilitoribacter multivorans]|uniref:DUF547 domain-containing protein n=1 Tax=Flaviramulus multivorans TaxID=1304750 RepID=A0ABS9IKT4_9FLAO|nr:DUF547 domain-containing protein [Flaviramulus multivorans]MCF7561223.1 DUF547 domain-containing protein [Flaviramulus multivorans]